MYISNVHSNAQLPVLTLIEDIFEESITVRFQGWISSPLLIAIEFVMRKTYLYTYFG